MSLTPSKAMEAQFYFAKKLKDHGVIVYFLGTPDIPDKCIATRWEMLRTTIIDFGLAATPFGKRDGTNETYAQAYERATGEPLQRKQAAA